jgi:DNA (cytosine-5)-methyltransferase 1
MLCGSRFGLKVWRHRAFESNFLGLPEFVPSYSCRHGRERPIGVYGDHPQAHNGDGYRVPRARSIAEAREAMGIDWMEWSEITQAVPPAYAEFIGRAALRYLGH